MITMSLKKLRRLKKKMTLNNLNPGLHYQILKNTSGSVATEDLSKSVGIDWDERWEDRFWARIMEEKEEKRNQLILIAQQKEEGEIKYQ